jgi:hypothetical protein
VSSIFCTSSVHSCMVQLPFFPKSLCHFHFLLCSMLFWCQYYNHYFFWKLASSSFLAIFCVVNETTIVSLKLTSSSFFVVFYILCHCDFHIALFKVCVFSPSFYFICFLNHSVIVFFWQGLIMELFIIIIVRLIEVVLFA